MEKPCAIDLRVIPGAIGRRSIQTPPPLRYLQEFSRLSIRRFLPLRIVLSFPIQIK